MASSTFSRLGTGSIAARSGSSRRLREPIKSKFNGEGRTGPPDGLKLPSRSPSRRRWILPRGSSQLIRISNCAVPSAWESQLAPAHEKMALQLAGQCVRKSATIYDIGANLGLYSVLLSRIAGSGGHVYCLEANPVCLYFLQANLALNRVASFDILPVAVLGTTTGSEFRINYRNLLVGIAGPVPYMGKPGHIIDVRATPLDDLIELHDLRPPDFIKMDIEGAEVEAIKGMRRTVERYHPTMLVELHGQDAARGTLDAADWNGYSFQEASSGRSFETAASLSAWFPDACLQVIAKHS